MKLTKGTKVVLHVGDYYEPMSFGVFEVLKDFDTEQVEKEYFELFPEEWTSPYMGITHMKSNKSIVKWMQDVGKIELVPQQVEWLVLSWKKVEE